MNYLKYILTLLFLICFASAATQTITVKVDEDGTARAYIKGLQENDTVSISAKTSDPLVPAKSGEVIVKNYASEVELPTYNSTLYGTEANTADYNEDFTVIASNLMPGTTVKWSATNGITPKTETTTVGDDGKTSVVFNANSDYSIKDSDITMEYHQSASQTLTNTKNLKFKQYTLALTTDKTEIVGDEQYVATLSGGKPGEAVTWTVTGDSELVSKEDVFDSNGQAKYTACGKSPFGDENGEGTLTVSGSSTLANNAASGSVSFKLLTVTYRLSGYHYFNGGEYFSLGSKAVPIPFENVKYALISAPVAGSVGGVFHPDQQVAQDEYSGLYAYTKILTSDSSTNTISGYIDARTSYFGTGSRRTGRDGNWEIYYVDLIIKHNYNHLND